MNKKRCEWPGDSPKMIEYHDIVWGKPEHDDREIFKAILLDTFQAGLSWAIILRKRENFRKAFANFNPQKIAKFDERKIQELLRDEGIVRNNLKIRGTVKNAKVFLEVQKEFGSFDKYIWQFTQGKTIKNKKKKMSQIPTSTKESDAMSKDMKKRGFTFMGTTICYAFMQGIGMANDHTIDCFKYNEDSLAFSHRNNCSRSKKQ